VTPPIVAAAAAQSERQPVRILSVIHVDWHWIRQRPQALAEALNKIGGLEVRVAYLPKWRRGQLTRNRSAVRRMAIPQLPFGRFRFVRRVNVLLGRRALGMVAASWRPDVTMVAYPTLVEMLPERLLAGPIVYDCMDIAAAFGRSAEGRSEIEAAERALLARAELVLASSQYIADTLASNIPEGLPVVVVRNGFNGRIEALPPGRAGPIEGPLRLGYFGTVSHWFDQALITVALTRDPSLELDVWGPQAEPLAPHPRIHVHGPIAHERLSEVVARVDALVMPFRVDDLIRGVDPVKLYEYVALGRPVLSVYYPELEQFRDLVHFYRDDDEFDALLRSLRADPGALRPPASAAAFLAGATWQSRAEVAGRAIADVAEARRR
jgi:glycosyl transferase family 4